MAKRNELTPKDRLRRSIYVMFTIQIMLITYATFHSPFIASNYTNIMVICGLISFGLGFYLLNLQNVKGWWLRKFFEAKQKVDFERSVKKEIARQRGLGYDKK